MARIIYLYRHMSEYIQIDLDLLRERHAVTVVECASRWPHPLLLFRLVTQADLVAAWFASWHSFVPAVLCRLLGKPFVVCTGGYDTARLPGIDYGHQRGGFRRFVALTTMPLPGRVIVVSEASRLEVLGLGPPAPKGTLCGQGPDSGRYPVPTL